MLDLTLQPLIMNIYEQLLPQLQLESLNPHNPVVVYSVPNSWHLLGSGNYAAVFYHCNYPNHVVKVYASGRPGWQEEVEVYRRLGSHPSFSECFYADDNFLVLKRLQGITLYNCLQLGIYIPEQVIRDIDQALEAARQRGLYPHDVHGRNVMMWQGRGLVVDVSDFLNPETCSAWKDLKWGYYWIYRPLFSWLQVSVPYQLLDMTRLLYRTYRQYRARLFR
jgi:hypothetical protein